MHVEVRIVNAFTDGTVGGNPAGVVLDADALSTAQKQAIAARVGLSETAFVSASEVAPFKLEFFTPNRQVAHCGHATVATFSLLRELGRVAPGASAKETIDGRRSVFVEREQVFMEQPSPRYQLLDDGQQAQLLQALGLLPAQLVDGLPVERVSTGLGFVIVPLRSEADVAGIRIDTPALEQLSEALDLVGVYAFSQQIRQPDRHAGARMFAPRYGIAEESATGMAAGPLACYLHDRVGLKQPVLRIEQGHLMQPPSPSLITVEFDLERDAILRLMAGGAAQVMQTLTLDL